MKKWMPIIVFAVVAMAGKSQNSVSYGYDANGNRVQRYFVGLRIANPDLSFGSDSTKVSDNIQQQGINVYPNPTADKLTVSINRSDKSDEWQTSKLYLTDLTGRTLLHKKCTGTETNFDMTYVPPGQYIPTPLVLV